MRSVPDTWGKGYPTLRPLPARLLEHIKHLQTLEFREKLVYLSGKAVRVLGKVASSLGWPSVERIPPDVSRAMPPDEFLETGFLINHIAWCRYQPRIYPGRLVVFRAEQTPNWIGTCFDDPLLGWEALAGQEIEVCTIPGSHLTLLERENVEPLARKLNAFLRE